MACIFYRDLFGGWRWEMRQPDGSVMESPFSYPTRAECVAAAEKCGLPVEKPKGSEPEQAPDERRTSVLPRRSVLCVQSSRETQKFLQSALPEYRMVVTPTGFEALRCLNYAVFDLYILDYWLPDWSGVSLCRDIRKRDPRGPVCFYTASDRADYRKRALNAGASLYIQAPIKAAELSKKLRALVETADAESLRAKLEGERVIQSELEMRAALSPAGSGDVMDRAVSVIERTAKVKAYQAFIDAGGTRAHFERWWPQLFASAWASRRATMPGEVAAK